MVTAVEGNVSGVVALATLEPPVVREVGGKAASLIRLAQAGFDVPRGMVLAAGFFEPWLAEVRSSQEWQAVLAAARSCDAASPTMEQRAELADCCARARAVAVALPLDAGQRAALSLVEDDLGAASCAVRSSSPEEDLAGASFAGLYETVLGAEGAALEEAVRTCFCSCLDARVLLYKRKMGFEDLDPTIAVIVQELVDSEVAGVAFSLNPLTNDFDEVLVNASWGLGDALVTGEITPDTAVVDAVTGEVVEQRLGDKGGDRPDEPCLDSGRISELAQTVKRIEALYAEPVDVEWALADGRLRVLQARPVTTYVPLHESLQTAPGEPRRLYMDGYLTEGITMSEPTSPMADDAIETLIRMFVAWLVNRPPGALDCGAWGLHLGSGRMYMDMSMYLHLVGDKDEQLAKLSEEKNQLMAQVLLSSEIDRYRSATPPPHVRSLRLLGHLPRLLWNARRAVTTLLRPALRRARFDREYAAAIETFDAWMARPPDHSRSVVETFREDLERAGSTVMASSYPAFLHAAVSMFRIRGLADQKSPEQVAWADAIAGGGYEDDMIVEMGVAIYEMAMALPPAEFDDIEALEARLRARELPEAFLERWDAFVARYGCRGPLEMELANPKYGEAPSLALRQMANIRASGGAFDPRDMRRRQIARREEAYRKLHEALPRRKARRLEKSYDTCTRYAGSRELFKHHLMQVNDRLRRLLLHRADGFVAAGRLDRREQIFELRLEDVDRAGDDPDFDVRATVAERGAFARKARSRVRHFPMCIDSRGRILRPPPVYQDGALVGGALSPGVARGPVRVLNDPFEKTVRPGDILVAVTTDPGWTPLFLNAAGIILEIGGALQHGALIAREYGKPCVTGIQDVTTRFVDDQIVEVDGNAGVVRFVDAD